mmetsp:Transcript_16472/g.52499  ORF Transcript_16472/g.52499 Transcript_16472/m.52499 type:complete len:371 (-) Transcript_16472:157-1269(-)
MRGASVLATLLARERKDASALLLRAVSGVDPDNHLDSLEIDEIHVLMNKLNPGIDKKTVDEIFLQSDVHTDGQIDFKEFLTCLALGYLLDLIPDLNQSPSTFSLAPPSSTAGGDSKADPASAARQGKAAFDESGEAAATEATAAPTEQAEARAEPAAAAEAATVSGEEASEPTEPAKTAEPAATGGEAGSEATLPGETSPTEAVAVSKASGEEGTELADTDLKNHSTKRTTAALPKIFQDRKGVRRVFELATEMYLAFDSNCTGTITFTEMERVINSTTGESEMTKNTQEVRKRRNSLNGKMSSKNIGPSELRGDRKNSPMTELLSRDRWKELDWDSDGFITYQEFIVTYVKWIASLSDSLDTDDEEDEN